MQILYDSDNFVVVHVPMPEETSDELMSFGVALVKALETGEPIVEPPGSLAFEIVDKRNSKEVFLSGDWAQCFSRQIKAWQQNTPLQEEVEATLDGYAQLAQLPMVLQ